MSRESLALHTDFYQITMAATYYSHQMNGEATFSLFAHHLPPDRGFMVAAGLEPALNYLESFAYTDEDIDYLASLKRFDAKFLDFLKGLRFSGEVWAMPEGTVFFAGEPILEVTAPIMEAQLVETYLINVMNLHSILTSKAARCVMAAEGRICVDFSLRRTQGLDAGLAVARSSAIAGFTGTSNVAAAKAFDLVPVGTMAHSLVEAFGDEQSAFEAFAKTFPDHTVLLADTYDSRSGLKHAVEMAAKLKESGHKLVGVRLDSGDLVIMSRRAREMLNQAGLEKASVVVSGSLDELAIARLLADGAQVDTFGIGTKMGCSADAPYLDLAYKLVSYQGRPTLKLSSGKETWASPKQLWRRLDAQGHIKEDILSLRQEEQDGQPLLEPVMSQGKRLGPKQDWRQAKARYENQRQALPRACLRLGGPVPIQVEASPALKAVQDAARRAALNNLP
jgi:nicotinate phosphoribosyltransferase